MDADWDEVARLALPPPGVHAVPTPVATMAFDNSQELLWVGNEYGRVSSFYAVDLSRYTSFKAHPSTDGPIRQILVHERGIIALGQRSVHMASRRGFPIWHLVHENMKELRCMSFTSNAATEILIAGVQNQMFTIDVVKGEITKQLPSDDQYIMMKRCRHICAAKMSGVVNILDTKTFQILKTWNAHSALINDMDAQHEYIVTCGYSLRQGQNYMLDPLVNVFDLRNMVSLPPIPFPAGAAFVRMHPRMRTTSIVVSQLGQMHVVDLMNVNTSNVRQANVLGFLKMVEIAPSGEAIALADADSNVHLWGSLSRMHFAELSNPVEFADHMDVSQSLDWEVDSPLNTIGMPYYREQLLSAWPSHLAFSVGAPPPKLDLQVVSNLNAVRGEGVPWARNPKTRRRNEVYDTRANKAPPSIQAPKFLSERARDANASSLDRRISDVADSLGVAELSSLKAEVPVMYRNVEIKYSKFGVDDFDFGYYNKTKFSGLEIHIANSYANSLLQVLHFTPLVRNMALQHAATACVNSSCLLCELGYLFDMLEKAEGSICQATNLLKTLSNLPQASQNGLLEEDTHGNSLTIMLQSLSRFLMTKLEKDYKSMAPRSSAFEQLFSTSATVLFRCINCTGEHTKPGATYVNDLQYTIQKPGLRNARSQKVSFCQILKSSVERDSTIRAWCPRCTRYQSLATRKIVHDTPDVMLLNAAISSPEAKVLWETPGWLPEEIGIVLDQGQFFCFEGDDLRLHLQRGTHKIKVYSLTGIAADVDSGQHQKSHLVSLINVASSNEISSTQSDWHLFNDFLVRPTKKEDALTFNTTWKLPSIIVYQVKSGNNKIDHSWKQNLDTSLLYSDDNKLTKSKTYQSLNVGVERPVPGSIVAIDTEFVSIRQPEIEMNADGERATIRPIVYALARVSVLRGPSSSAFESTLEPGTPFIDDYIATTEPIVDYLTSYSGIVAGDLDPMTSKHNLVPLKLAYKKLWILLNLGCCFLGHGLKQDFRVINIHVPKLQIIDTAEFFFVKERLRKLSLAFLAWVLLKEEIQAETHDSIEDARTALKLYMKYQEFMDAGIMEPMLRDIYAKGREVGFKPPSKGRVAELSDALDTPVKK